MAEEPSIEALVRFLRSGQGSDRRVLDLEEKPPTESDDVVVEDKED